MGNEEVDGAALFPDSRILFWKGSDLFVADKDESNPRKLISIVEDTGYPSVSPDGRRIAFGMISPDRRESLVEIGSDGKGLSTILSAGQYERFGASVEWTPDGKYLLYRKAKGSESDLWLLPMQTGFLIGQG